MFNISGRRSTWSTLKQEATNRALEGWPALPEAGEGQKLQIFNRLLHIFRVHPKDGALLEARLGLGWKRAERTPVLLSSRSPQPVCCLAAAHRGWKSTLRRTAAAGRRFSPKSKTHSTWKAPKAIQPSALLACYR